MPQFKNVWKRSIFHFEKRSKFVSPQLNIAPLIDVIFLLLIFFMLTSTFVSQTGIKINLPKAVSSKVLLKDRLIITIDEKNSLYIHDKKITEKELRSILKEVAASKKSLLIMADKSSSVGKIVEVWDICRQAGITQINIATQSR
jgi:biopolymer transport protein ExbD